MRALIVEDDKISAKVLESILKKYADCQVAPNGQLGYDYFCDAFESGNPFDLICLDIMMPEVDGQELLLAIREYEESNNIFDEKGAKIIMTSALSDPSNLYMATASNCSDYLTKPITKKRLIKVLKKIGLIDTEE